MYKKDVEKYKDGEIVSKLESVEVVLVHFNLVKNDYQHTSKFLFSFVPNKQFGQLITVNINNKYYGGITFIPLKIKLQKILDSYIKESITLMIIASSKFTYKTKLKKVQSKEKHTLRIIFNQSKTSPFEPPFLSLNVLNVYQINIFQSVQFMHKIKKQKCFVYLP